MRRVSLAFIALIAIGCNSTETASVQTPAAMPTLITKAATEYGEIEVVALFQISKGELELSNPDGTAYEGVVREIFPWDFTTSQDTQASGICFQLPEGMPKPGSPGVYYDGKSAIHASFTPQGNHSFVMVEEEFDGRPFQVRFPLQPETMIAKGNWPIDGTISISDFGRLSQHPDQRQSISLDLNQAHRDLEFTVFLYDESGNRLDLLSSGSQLDKAGYPVSYWWQSEGTDKATSFEVWQGKAVNVEFSGIVIPASNLN